MLFGHQNDTNIQPVPTAAPAADSSIGVNPLAVDPATGASLPVAPPTPPELDEPSVLNQPMTPVVDTTSNDNGVSSVTPFATTPTPPAPPAPPVPEPPAPALVTEEPSPFETPEAPETPELPAAPVLPIADETPYETPEPAKEDAPADDDNTSGTNTDLLTLKQQALAQLEPLVGQLDQTPEERFRTTMMMLQSTDNQSLIQSAYEAAQQITDEKVRAQALLDVVNEINYFTQAKSGN